MRKKNKKINKKALAVVIGVVLLCMPWILDYRYKCEIKTKVKSGYEDIIKSMNDFEIKTGEPLKSWPMNRLFLIIKNGLPVINIGCYVPNECMADFKEYKTLNGADSSNIAVLRKNENGEVYQMKLANGAALAIVDNAGDEKHSCTQPYRFYQTDNICPILYDINGSKGPNIFGEDLFQFDLTAEGLKPASIGDGSNDEAECSGKTSSGRTCSAKIINDNDISYLSK